jgi:hypothetical protein
VLTVGIDLFAEGVWLDRFVKAVEAGTCAADDIGSMLEDGE